ncbi:MAG: hypothetical protein HXS54_17520 [Theionarchaea archaeon]|nr:hypothetical protein [Theionarchaea archaeon]
MMHEDQPSAKETPRITVENNSSSIKALTNAVNLKEEQGIPDLSKGEPESAELGAEILIHIPFKEIADLLGERDADIKVRFCNLVLNGEAHMVITRRMQ